LWAGLLGPPVLWLALLQTNYVLAYAACGARETWFLYAAIAATLVLGALAGLAAWRMGPPEHGEARSAPWDPNTREIRARWMSASALAITAWFLIVMVAMAVPVLILQTCD
jgi:hypothetical protein